MERAVVVCNAFPDDNKGGCAITQQTIEWLKWVYPERPVYIVPVEPAGKHDVRRYRFTLGRHPETRILRCPIRTDGSFPTTIRMLVKSVALLRGRPGDSEFERTVAGAAVVVSKGGYVFVERDTLGGMLGLWFTAYPLVYASRRKIPTVALCTTVGPYRRTASRLLCRWILKEVDLVITRDPISTYEARRLGCRTVREIPDIALTFDESRIKSAPLGSKGIDKYAVIAISAETPELDAVFLDRMAKLCGRLLDARIVDRLVVALQSREDHTISSQFVAALADSRIESMNDDLAPEALMALYGQAEFLIGRRLHAGIFSLLVGVPVILFSTDGVKANGVMQELGLADRVFPYPGFSVEEVLSCIEEITTGTEERVRVREVVRRARERIATGLEAVAEALRNGRPNARRAELGA